MNKKQRRLIILGIVLGVWCVAMLFRPPSVFSLSREDESKEIALEECLDVITPKERAIFENRVKVLVELLELDEEQEWELSFYFEGITSDIAGGAPLAQKDLEEALYGAGLRPILERVMTDRQRIVFERNQEALGFSSEGGKE